MTRSRYATHSEPSTLSVGFIHAHVVAHQDARRQRVRDALGEAGFEIEVFPSAASAIPMVRKNPPSLLIVADDLTGSPDAAGLLKWLGNQDFGEAVHTLVICDMDSDDRAKHLLGLGGCDVLSLDFTEAELRERLIIAEFRSAFLRKRLDESRHLQIQASQYRQIVRHWPQAAILTPNLSRPIKEVNDRALQILGLNRDEVEGRYLSLVLPDLFERDDFIPYNDFSKHPERLEDVVYESPNGNTILEVRIVGVEWGNEGAVLVTFENHGRLRAIERHRSRITQMESVRRFASQMAHEFNNILTVVNGNLALMQEAGEAPSETAQNLIESSQRACARASDLVKRLTKQETVAAPNVTTHDVRKIVDAAQARAVLSSKARVQLTVADDLWAVRADPEQATEVLKALLKNADEALANSTIEVDIDNQAINDATDLPLEPDEYVRITVTDQGAGIRDEDAERVFEPFFTTKSGAEGQGLCRALQIAEQHGGTIQFDASPTGTGASFILHLPAEGPSAKAAASQDSDRPASLSSGVSPFVAVEARDGETAGQKDSTPHIPRVLFMDDEPDIRNIVDKILTANDFEVTCTSTGEEAIEAYYQGVKQDQPYDVLLLDLEVAGGMGGKDTVATLRQDFPNIKAVVTTGYLDDAVLSNHREHGFSGILTKPFQIEDLLSVLRVLGGPTG